MQLQKCQNELNNQLSLSLSTETPSFHQLLDSTIKPLFDSIHSLFTEGFEKKEKVDWFPYPQLYPPGKQYHIQQNPMNGIMDDYDLLAETAMRLEKGTGAGIIENKEIVRDTQLIEVGKEEFDHYSLHESLFEDHRIGNYVWGLCRVYDSHFKDLE